jgi:hypothetical protein
VANHILYILLRNRWVRNTYVFFGMYVVWLKKDIRVPLTTNT